MPDHECDPTDPEYLGVGGVMNECQICGLPRVTVVLVHDVPHLPWEPLRDVLERELSGPVLAAVHAVEQQTYPKRLVDVHLVRNVERYPVEAMRRFGVERAGTEWVAFADENETWAPDTLERLVAYTSGTDRVTGVGATLVRRGQYLEETA